MIHDQGLVDQLSALPVERFEGEVFRATSITADPLASSVSGGRWAPRAEDGVDVPVLYTSLERDGALAEVASFLMLLTPLPSKPLKVARLGVSTAKTLRLAHASLAELGVDIARYGERDYGRTQNIGAALAFLGLDGLIAPSARWSCDNLTIFTSNSHLCERLEVIRVEHVNWRAWAQENGFLRMTEVILVDCRSTPQVIRRTSARMHSCRTTRAAVTVDAGLIIIGQTSSPPSDFDGVERHDLDIASIVDRGTEPQRQRPGPAGAQARRPPSRR